LRTRTRNALLLCLAAALLCAALFAAARRGPRARSRPTALGFVPGAAAVVVTADLGRLRSSPLAALLRLDEARDALAAGAGPTCGFDPLDRVTEIAFWMPENAESDFGLSAAGDLGADELARCASATIAARGGRPTTTRSSGFVLVSDASLGAGAASIAVREPGVVLLGRAAPLGRMMAVAGGRGEGVLDGGAHARLRAELGPGGDVRATVVLSATQRDRLRADPEPGSEELSSVLAAGASLDAGPRAVLRALVLCERAAACEKLARALTERRDEIRASTALRLAGVASLLERARIESRGDRLSVSVEVPSEDLVRVAQRIVRWDRALAGSDAPPAASRARPGVLVAPDEVLRARTAGDGGR
jgi:hypothetical protein